MAGQLTISRSEFPAGSTPPYPHRPKWALESRRRAYAECCIRYHHNSHHYCKFIQLPQTHPPLTSRVPPSFTETPPVKNKMHTAKKYSTLRYVDGGALAKHGPTREGNRVQIPDINTKFKECDSLHVHTSH